jgi:uncharacterized lipoprotein YddW (UPF0748 family)
MLFFAVAINAQNHPKEEVRAVWLTTIWNIDWPKTTGESAQKLELQGILDSLLDANFNTIYFQARVRGDVNYNSTIEPWARWFSGTSGQSPGWDPLEYVIEQAHIRGMEVHAWFVTYNVHSGTSSPASAQHVANQHPSWITQWVSSSGTTLWWLNPGVPQVKDYLVSLVAELVNNYEVDGIQFDYIRYPDDNFNDAVQYNTYGNGVPLADWRRENINQFVREAYDTIQQLKPDVKVGSAPIGIYQNIPNATGWEGYHEIYQDSRQWMVENKHDYLCPQIYWDINTNPMFNVLVNDWVQNANSRHVYPGVAAYRMLANNWSAFEILSQVDGARNNQGKGQAMFSAYDIYSNTNSLMTQLKNSKYLYPANIPSMPWKDSLPPNAPVISSVNHNNGSYQISWSVPALPSDLDTVKYYNVYASTSSPIDISDISNVVAFYVRGTSVTVNLNTVPANTHFLVTAYDNGYNESQPSLEYLGTGVPVGGSLPVADFSFSTTTICEGDSIYFTNNSQNADSFLWAFGQGSPYSSLENPAVSYQHSGTYTVSLVASNNGNNDMVTQNIAVTVLPDAIANYTFSTDTLFLPGAIAYFTNGSSHADSYVWDFGNGLTSTGEHPWSEYFSEGSYEVTLIAESATCDNDTLSSMITVLNSVGVLESPIAAFSFQLLQNPVRGVLDYLITSNKNGKGQFLLMDVTGKVLLKRDLPVAIGKHSFQEEISKLSRGNYQCVFVIEDQVFVKKVIKQ